MDLEQDNWANNQEDSKSLDIEGNVQTPCKHAHSSYTRTRAFSSSLLTSSITEPSEPPGLCKRLVMGFCGLEQSQQAKLTPEEEEELKKKLTDISEKPLWRNVVNVNALILLAIAFFCHGYFA